MLLVKENGIKLWYNTAYSINMNTIHKIEMAVVTGLIAAGAATILGHNSNKDTLLRPTATPVETGWTWAQIVNHLNTNEGELNPAHPDFILPPSAAEAAATQARISDILGTPYPIGPIRGTPVPGMRLR